MRKISSFNFVTLNGFFEGLNHDLSWHKHGSQENDYSGSIVTQFAEQGLIDEIQVMVDPVALGKGTPLFKNLRNQINLELTNTRTFKSGVVLLCYKPA